MNDVQYLLLFGLPLLLLIGVPIYAALGVVGIGAVYLQGTPIIFTGQSLLNGVDNFPLLAIPAFVLAGKILEKSGVVHDLLKVFQLTLGNIPGGLGVVTIATCMFFAAISGSGPGTVAAVGGLMIPAMIRAGYTPGYAGAVSASGGSLGVLIPPSNPMIVYAIIANVSVSELFIAGAIPGLLFGIGLAITAYFTAFYREKEAIRVGQMSGVSDTTFGRKFSLAVWKAKWGIFMPIIVLGGIYSGVFTPVEASVAAVLYSLIVAIFIYRKLTFKALNEAFSETHILSGALMLIVGISTLFARVITLEHVPQQLAETIQLVAPNALVLLLLICLLLLILGAFLETMAAIIILAPILVPIVTSYGIDPIHFGIILIITVQIAFLTPPLGVNLFVAAKIANVPVWTIVRAILPFLIALLLMLAVAVLVPPLSLWLPEVLR